MLKFAVVLFLLIVGTPRPCLALEGEPELLHLYQYKPIYFIMGNPYAKIELSFKTQIVSTIPFYFAYTQLMFWDVFIPSPYFEELNYNPLVFYRYLIHSEQDQWVDLIPLEHESNGRGGTDERSWNRIGAAYPTSTRLGDRARLFFDFKAWLPFDYQANNSDIPQYRGVWEAQIATSNFIGQFFEFDDLTFRFYPGGARFINPLHGGQELTFRTKTVHRTFLPLFVAQIFHGYGESLIDAQDDRWGFRAGLGF